eukprot:8962923-Pyramimonas_sp.AAC.1
MWRRGPSARESLPHHCPGFASRRRREDAIAVQARASWRLEQGGLSHDRNAILDALPSLYLPGDAAFQRRRTAQGGVAD